MCLVCFLSDLCVLLKFHYLCFQQGISGPPPGMMIIIIMAHHICHLPQEDEDGEAEEASLTLATITAMMTIMNTMAMTITIIEVAMKIRTMAMKTFKFKVEGEGVEELVDPLCPGVELHLQLEEEVSPSVEAQDPAEEHGPLGEELNKEAVWYVICD